MNDTKSFFSIKSNKKPDQEEKKKKKEKKCTSRNIVFKLEKTKYKRKIAKRSDSSYIRRNRKSKYI